VVGCQQRKHRRVAIKTATRTDSNRRLDSLSAGKTGATRFPNLKYNYDRVGNVVRLANNVPVGGPSTFGGPTEETFTYDDVYRPTSSAGTYQFAPSKTNRYSMDLSYDSVHKHPVQDADPRLRLAVGRTSNTAQNYI
jgi:hypothetical protein